MSLAALRHEVANFKLAKVPEIRGLLIDNDVDRVTVTVRLPVAYEGGEANKFDGPTVDLVRRVEQALEGFQFVRSRVCLVDDDAKQYYEEFEYWYDVPADVQAHLLNLRAVRLYELSHVTSYKVVTTDSNGETLRPSRMYVIVTPASTASVAVINAVLEGMSSYVDDGKLVYTF